MESTIGRPIKKRELAMASINTHVIKRKSVGDRRDITQYADTDATLFRSARYFFWAGLGYL